MKICSRFTYVNTATSHVCVCVYVSQGADGPPGTPGAIGPKGVVVSASYYPLCVSSCTSHWSENIGARW